MANPDLLFFDTDALLQILIAEAVPVLRELKTAYGVQPTIVPEVEIEISSSKKFGPRLYPTLKKAISRNTIAFMDATTYPVLLSQTASLQSAGVGVSYADIQTLGASLSRRVDRGESYTFAAAVKLVQPAASNDFSAVRTMKRAALPLPPTILRAYDLLVFAYQANLMSDQQCDDCRTRLLNESESIPQKLKSYGFVAGLQFFEPRLVDGSKTRVGLLPPPGVIDFSAPLIIRPV